MHASHTAHRKATVWLLALVGSAALLLAAPAVGHAEESNPNNYSCLGSLAPGQPEPGSEEQQINYTFYCDGPITGYQLESNDPVTGISGQPLVSKNRIALNEIFSCEGELPGYAVNCVGLAKEGYDDVTGEFAIGTKICAEPRVDTLLTVTYATVEKGVVNQAISGPFDLGRPKGCPPDAESGFDRLNPKPAGASSHHKGKKKKGKKSKKK